MINRAISFAQHLVLAAVDGAVDVLAGCLYGMLQVVAFAEKSGDA